MTWRRREACPAALLRGAPPQFDSWLLKTDGSLTKVWDITFEESGREEGSSVLAAEDGGYVTTGWTISSGNADLWFAKINK